MIKFKSIFLSFIFVALFNCCVLENICDSKLEIALDLSGDNCSEIKKSLNYYEQNTEKREAMNYLVSNMIYKESEDIGINTFILNKIEEDSLKATNEIYKIIADNKLLMHSNLDLTKVDAEYLIKNVDQAYSTWKNVKWSKEISFETFCEYILPYNIDNEPIVEWREWLKNKYGFLTKDVTNLKDAYLRVYDYMTKNMTNNRLDYPYKQDIRMLAKINGGDCEARAKFIVYVLRALGIPSSVDFTPKWSNCGDNSHMWAALVLDNKSTFVTSKDSVGIIDGMYERSKYSLKEDYKYNVDSLKKIAKVFRKTLYCPLKMDRIKDMPPFFNNIRLKDVTFSYPNSICSKRVNLLRSVDKPIFLCTFNQIDGWIPVGFAERLDSKSASIGATISENVIVIGEYNNDIVDVVSNPYIISDKGVIELRPNKKSLKNIKLTRKYILLNRWINRWGDVLGTVIDTSNDENFSSDVMHISIIKDFPCEKIGIDIKEDKILNYVRILPAKSKYPVFAEIKLKNNSGIEIEKDRFRLYARGGSLDGDSIVTNSLIDNKESTTFFKLFQFWIGIDVSKCKDEVSEIELVLWNDGNRIKPRCRYELFYMDNGIWQSLGEKIAKEDCVEFEGAPENALFLLRNLSEGSEERIFTYEKEKQIWW